MHGLKDIVSVEFLEAYPYPAAVVSTTPDSPPNSIDLVYTNSRWVAVSGARSLKDSIDDVTLKDLQRWIEDARQRRRAEEGRGNEKDGVVPGLGGRDDSGTAMDVDISDQMASSTLGPEAEGQVRGPEVPQMNVASPDHFVLQIGANAPLELIPVVIPSAPNYVTLITIPMAIARPPRPRPTTTFSTRSLPQTLLSTSPDTPVDSHTPMPLPSNIPESMDFFPSRTSSPYNVPHSPHVPSSSFTSDAPPRSGDSNNSGPMDMDHFRNRESRTGEREMARLKEERRRLKLATEVDGSVSCDFLMEHKDWSTTTLGPKKDWPQSLKTAVSIVRSAPGQVALWWGKNDYTLIYNDIYRRIVGTKHPSLMGMRGPDGWREIWPQIEGVAKMVMETGETFESQDESMLFNSEANAKNPECALVEFFHTWSFIPVRDESGDVNGLLNFSTNVTSKCLAERRLAIVRELNHRIMKARDQHEWETAVLSALRQEKAAKDVPFVALYAVDHGKDPSEGHSDTHSLSSAGSINSHVELRCVGTIGFPDDHPAVPSKVEFEYTRTPRKRRRQTLGYSARDDILYGGTDPWPFKQCVAGRQAVLVEDCSSIVAGDVPIEPRSYGVIATRAIVVPLTSSTDHQQPVNYVVVMGLNPRCKFKADTEYQDFMDSLTNYMLSGLTQIKADLASKLEDQMEEARYRQGVAEEERKQQELLADITAHEIKTPLSAVIGCAELSKNNLSQLYTALETAYRSGLPFIPTLGLLTEISADVDSLDAIHACAINLIALTADILTLSKARLDLLDLHVTDTNIPQLAGQIIQMFGQTARINSIHLTLELHPSIVAFPSIKTDSVRISQLFNNLITNSSKFIVDRPVRNITLRIGLSTAAPLEGTCEMPTMVAMPTSLPVGHPVYLYGSVEDTGPGLPAEEMKKLFLRFSQATHDPNKAFGGTGLGLYITRLICEMLGGQIECVSEVGTGSTFRFYVKTDIARYSKPASPQPRDITPTRPPHVLLVEDDPILLKIMKRTLLKNEMTCETAVDGQEALDRIRESNGVSSDELTSRPQRFDVVITDWSMPRMDGLTFCRIVREEEQAGKLEGRQIIVGLTGNGRDVQVRHALSQGLDEVLVKPCKNNDLLAKIRELSTKTASSRK